MKSYLEEQIAIVHNLTGQRHPLNAQLKSKKQILKHEPIKTGLAVTVCEIKKQIAFTETTQLSYNYKMFVLFIYNEPFSLSVCVADYGWVERNISLCKLLFLLTQDLKMSI